MADQGAAAAVGGQGPAASRRLAYLTCRCVCPKAPLARPMPSENYVRAAEGRTEMGVEESVARANQGLGMCVLGTKGSEDAGHRCAPGASVAPRAGLA